MAAGGDGEPVQRSGAPEARSPIVMNEELISRAAVESNPERAGSDREREGILRTALQGLTERERTAW
jgi:hypothetical protein